MFYAVLLIGLMLEMARAAQAGDECEEVTGSDPNTCKTCSAVINGKKYCSQCNDSGSQSAPTDGKCTADNNECSTKNNGVCTQCAHESFMYKGGCYKKATEPGNTMCETANAGVCTQAKAGYFVPPGADRDNAHQSVIPCGDVEEVLVGNSHKYKGVLHCKVCDAPKAAASDTNPVPATCTTCEDGFFGPTCEACQDENCATCAVTGNNKCSKCKGTGTKTYLKVDGGSTGTCVEASGCTAATFPKVDEQQGNKCAACNSAPDGGIANCATCSLLTQGSRATPLVTCLTCEQNKYLTPEKNACLDACPAGMYANSKVCTPCHESCASCSTNAKTSCTACYPGYVLSKGDDGATGTCIPECTGRYAENCADGQCTAVVGGSKYCSKCKAGYAPVDGICVSTATREVMGCTPGNDGTCTACTGSYFLQSGGCYQSTAYPGNTLCSSAQNGQCQTCAANGQSPAGGKCPECSEGCAKCGASNSDVCTECYSGYYRTGTGKCFKCAADSDNGIVGVPNCVSCAPPTNGQGSVICYITRQETDDGTGGDTGGDSMNKSGLSTGTIAGISVAVIVVVGGLVGFLCWWFVCRGKA
ncbi:VSP [Giardia duodenalis]|uniref:VSP n=1 Tax=Giardia intestinalis (strain ATCC 50803 / WB clone C6) TaxID=184922 RepID=A8BBQ0_GIAIC|nr:VSP [Giardia intestinalis]KAE8305263.1 VSP [Giardia intestinalis]|eukprot:XP_001708033.1 VSP [Giardia lamblia ATCC 50803]